LRADYLAFVSARGETAVDRDAGPEHLTASCFIFTPDLSRVLLCFHKKGQFWVQLGGHIESTDESVAAAAFREAHEEGGIHALRPLGNGILDLDRHALGTSFGRCGVHWDVSYGATADSDAVPTTSSESEDVVWWPVNELPAKVPANFTQRMQGVLREIARQRSE
jgi:8-oxo-dGTP pyrophosphatase MutT (NUDIX family)